MGGKSLVRRQVSDPRPSESETPDFCSGPRLLVGNDSHIQDHPTMSECSNVH